MTGSEWRVVGVSVAGFSHEQHGTSCQDAHAALAASGGWMVAVVADGAGSTPYGGEGADILGRVLVEQFAKHLGAAPTDADMGDWSGRTWVKSAIEVARQRIAEAAAARTAPLSAFAATLVGAVTGPRGGLLFHIGDGAGAAWRAGAHGADRAEVLSPAQNGTYANETFFVTDPDWTDQLRFTPFGAACDSLVLMSDGVTPFALAPRGQEVYRPFLDPVHAYLCTQDDNTARRALDELLRRDALRAITGDDKTLLWAHRPCPSPPAD